jgi:thiol-disulfide isomerase/thioredoxin
MSKIIYCLLFVFFFDCPAYPQKIFEAVLNTEQQKPFALTELKKNKASVVIFFDTDCPICKNYTLTVNELSQTNADAGIKFYLLFPEKSATAQQLTTFKEYYKLQPQLLLDNTHNVTSQLKPKVTPEVFILNARGEIIYNGSIDNWMYQTGKKRTVITKHFLKDALTALSNGKDIPNKKNKAYGCLIEY